MPDEIFAHESGDWFLDNCDKENEALYIRKGLAVRKSLLEKHLGDLQELINFNNEQGNKGVVDGIVMAKASLFALINCEDCLIAKGQK